MEIVYRARNLIAFRKIIVWLHHLPIPWDVIPFIADYLVPHYVINSSYHNKHTYKDITQIMYTGSGDRLRQYVYAESWTIICALTGKMFFMGPKKSARNLATAATIIDDDYTLSLLFADVGKNSHFSDDYEDYRKHYRKLSYKVFDAPYDVRSLTKPLTVEDLNSAILPHIIDAQACRTLNLMIQREDYSTLIRSIIQGRHTALYLSLPASIRSAYFLQACKRNDVKTIKYMMHTISDAQSIIRKVYFGNKRAHKKLFSLVRETTWC